MSLGTPENSAIQKLSIIIIMCALFSQEILQAGAVKGLRLFPASHEHMHRFLSKCTAFKVRFVIGPSNMPLQTCMFALFSPEIVQAGAVKGLRRGGVRPLLQPLVVLVTPRGRD